MKINIGDKIITRMGLVGEVANICNCEKCIERNWKEPIVKYQDGSVDYITEGIYNNLPIYYHKIGDTIISELDHEAIKKESIKALKQLRHLLGWENMWVAKDTDDFGQYVYQCKPYKVEDEWYIMDGDFVDILNFPHPLDFIKPTDEEPFEVV